MEARLLGCCDNRRRGLRGSSLWRHGCGFKTKYGGDSQEMDLPVMQRALYDVYIGAPSFPSQSCQSSAGPSVRSATCELVAVRRRTDGLMPVGVKKDRLDGSNACSSHIR